MPTMRTNNPEYIEERFPVTLGVHGTTTGGYGLLVNEDWPNPFPATGFFEYNLQEALHSVQLGFGMLENSRAEIKGGGISIVVSLKNLGQLLTGSSDHDYLPPMTGTPELPEQRLAVELSPLVRKQVEHILTGSPSKLQERIYQFGNEYPGLEQVVESTKSALTNFVAWLSSQSDTVSATLSNDGMISIAAVFPNEVRLYVEIERSGSTGAAVTRERRYARDVPVHTVADLTPEVILAAVESI